MRRLFAATLAAALASTALIACLDIPCGPDDSWVVQKQVARRQITGDSSGALTQCDFGSPLLGKGEVIAVTAAVGSTVTEEFDFNDDLSESQQSCDTQKQAIGDPSFWCDGADAGTYTIAPDPALAACIHTVDPFPPLEKISAASGVIVWRVVHSGPLRLAIDEPCPYPAPDGGSDAGADGVADSSDAGVTYVWTDMTVLAQ
ncbi:MAG: hypothetical protein ACHREM_33715 [Polyangiales bacterium]